MNPTPPESNQEPISSNEEIAQLLQRIQALEQYAESNRRRIRNSKALNALLVVLTPFFLLSGDIQFGEKLSGNLRSRDFDSGDVASLLAIGGSALGVIGAEPLMKFLSRKT